MAGVTATVVKTTMTSRVRAYLAQKRALGFKLKSEGLLFLDFARFADRKQHLGPIDLQVALGWATRPKSWRLGRISSLPHHQDLGRTLGVHRP